MGRIITMLCTCVALAIWEFWGQGVYQYVLQTRGMTYDFATSVIGYMIPLVIALVLSWIIGRNRG